ncbi:MAG: TraB/GumN family protein [Clostridia bacterium]|nr:TraB/GumN family protein [Clostridia bacterium]
MKLFKRTISICLVLAVLLALSACDPQVVYKKDPAAEEAYEAGLSYYATADAYTMEISVTTEKCVGMEYLTETSEYTAKYSGMTSDAPAVLITGNHTSPVEWTTEEHFASGTTTCRISGEEYTYQARESFAQFSARQIPYRMLDPDLYGRIKRDPRDDSRILFTEGSAPEAWVPYITPEYAAGIFAFSAEGWVLLKDGVAAEMEYTVNFTQGPADYAMTYRVTLSPAEHKAEELTLPSRGEVISVSDASLPCKLAYAAGYFEAFSGGTVQVLDQFAGGGVRFISREVLTDTCKDGEGNPSMLSMETVQRHTGFESVRTEVTRRKYTNGHAYYAQGQEDFSPVQQTEDFDRYLNGEILQQIPLPSLGDFESVAVMEEGEFLILEGKLKESFAAYGTALAEELDDSDGFCYETAVVSSLTCRLAMDRDTGYITAMEYALSAAFPATDAPHGFDLVRNVYIEKGDTSAYYRIHREPYREIDPSQGPKSSPLLYRVEDGKGNTAYLLGTIHVGNGLTSNLPDYVLDAFYASDALAVELDLNTFEQRLLEDEELAKAYDDSYFFSDGTLLKDYLEDPALYKKVSNLLFAMGYGGYGDAMKPAAVASVIEDWYLDSINWFTPEKGVDQTLLDLAMGKDIKVLEIEDPIKHYDALSGYSRETQIYLLESALAGGRYEYYLSAEFMNQFWCSGIPEYLKQSVAMELPPDATPEEKAYFEEYRQKMVTERDKIMTDGICGYLESGETVFVAVGLAHVIGEGGIMDQLTALGYTVTQVK